MVFTGSITLGQFQIFTKYGINDHGAFTAALRENIKVATILLRHLPENSIFGYLPPFAPAYEQHLDPTSTFIDKNVITGCYCINIYGEKAIPGCFHCPAISCHLPENSIFGHLPLLAPAYG